MNRFEWRLKNAEIHNNSALIEELGIHPKLSFLLAQRGIITKDDALEFFNPRIHQIHSPFLMKDMSIASERLISAINSNQKILVYGDYDVDGTTAVSIMYSFLKQLDCNVEYYVPDRYAEGYGVSMMGINFAIKESFDLIITLDCGIKANKTISYAVENGIDVIICDHHEPGEILPPAVAILNHKQKDCYYPCKHLSGCGVGFKLVHAVCETLELDLKEYLYVYVDILAISIASDIVPIVEENRTFMYYGLRKMQDKPHIGVRAMLQSAGIEGQEISVSDVVFKIGPRINAAGRIYNARKAIELLIETNFDTAIGLCSGINDYNEERKAIDKSITQEALQIIESTVSFKNECATVLYKPEWHKGVIGIVASRVIEHYFKPTIIFCGNDDVITASARSVDGFDIYSALEECKEFMVHFGGHMYAAGMAIKKTDFEAFSRKFKDVVAQRILEDQKVAKIDIDIELEVQDINYDFYNVLKRFGPFGPGNMTPIFMIKGAVDSGRTKMVGEDKSHLKLEITHPNTPNIKLSGIAFGLAEKWMQIQKQTNTFDVCFVLSENVFRGRRSIQLEVRDIIAS